MIQKRRGYENESLDVLNSTALSEVNLYATEHKKSRMDDFNDQQAPSRVIHVRNVPNNASEEDIATLAIPFGRLTNMIYARRNNQALIEMEDISCAAQLVEFYRARPPRILNRSCVVQFSRHSQLDTRNDNSQMQRIIDQANLVRTTGGAHSLQSGILDTLSGIQSHTLAALNSSSNMGINDSHPVLHVMLENRAGEQINHLLLYKVFSQYGRVLRIVMFTKLRTEHALIECDNPMSALTSKLALDNRALLGGRYPMKIEFSKLERLEVRTENEKCRDFDRSPISVMERCAINALSLVADLVVDMDSSGRPISNGFSVAAANQLSQLSQLNCSSGVSDRNCNPTASAFDMLSGITNATSGDVYGNSGVALSNLAAMMRFSGLGGSLADSVYGSAFGDLSRISGVLAASGSIGSQDNCVLIVSNLNEEKADPDSLFTLFGVYGDVQRVKIMFNKKDTALIQFTDGQQALTAKDNLNGVIFYEKPLKINVSRHTSIQLPREDADVGLTKDYTNSSLHRFKNPMSKNHKNIYPAGPVLHLSNIPLEYSEVEITQLFQQLGFPVVDFRFLKDSNGKKKMALVQVPSTEQGVAALVKLHNFELSPNSNLRVSFSQRMSQKS